MHFQKPVSAPETNLRFSQLACQSLDGLFFLLHLCSAVLQLCLQQLRSLLVVGHPVVGFELSLLQLLNLLTQSLKKQKKKNINDLLLNHLAPNR